MRGCEFDSPLAIYFFSDATAPLPTDTSLTDTTFWGEGWGSRVPAWLQLLPLPNATSRANQLSSQKDHRHLWFWGWGWSRMPGSNCSLAPMPRRVQTNLAPKKASGKFGSILVDQFAEIGMVADLRHKEAVLALFRDRSSVGRKVGSGSSP